MVPLFVLVLGCLLLIWFVRFSFVVWFMVCLCALDCWLRAFRYCGVMLFWIV